MKRLMILIVVVVLVALTSTVAFAGGNSNVAYTWTVADLGQGIWGGGPLFADGSAGGNVAFSAGNGQIIYHVHPTGWSYIVPGVLLDLCFEVREIKGSSGLPPALCLSDFGEALPITGTPLLMDIDGDGNPDFVLRATPAN